MQLPMVAANRELKQRAHIMGAQCRDCKQDSPNQVKLSMSVAYKIRAKLRKSRPTYYAAWDNDPCRHTVARTKCMSLIHAMFKNLAAGWGQKLCPLYGLLWLLRSTQGPSVERNLSWLNAGPNVGPTWANWMQWVQRSAFNAVRSTQWVQRREFYAEINYSLDVTAWLLRVGAKQPPEFGKPSLKEKKPISCCLEPLFPAEINGAVSWLLSGALFSVK